MDSTGRVVSVRSGREWSDWSSELRMSGDELRWKFVSDSSVNGWGWRFTVYPIPPAAAPCDVLSDRALQSRPSIDLVRCLLGKNLNTVDPAMWNPGYLEFPYTLLAISNPLILCWLSRTPVILNNYFFDLLTFST